MQSYHIHIRGMVQGVGFRPFVYRVANDMDINGWISNASDGVHIECTATVWSENDIHCTESATA